jgi:hypothetical protein
VIKARGRTICSEDHKLFNSIWKEGMPEECKESFIVPGVIKQIVVNIQAYNFCQLHNKILYNILLSRLTPYAEEITGHH